MIKINSKLSFITNYRFFKNKLKQFELIDNQIKGIKKVDWLSGCFLVTNKKFLNMCGGFDERYFLYFEDVDLCRTAKELGFEIIYYPFLEVIHIGGYASSQSKGLIKSILLNKTSRLHIKSWIIYILKWKKDFLNFKTISFKINPKKDKC